MYISHIYSLSKRLQQLKLICLLVSMLIFIQLQFIHNYMTVKLGKMFQKFVMNSKMNPRVETISLSYLRRISFHIYVSVSLYLRNSTILDAVIHHSSPYSWLNIYILQTADCGTNWQLPAAILLQKWPLIWESPVSYPMPPGKLASSDWSTLRYKCQFCGHNAGWLYKPVQLQSFSISAYHSAQSDSLSLPSQEHPRTPHMKE